MKRLWNQQYKTVGLFVVLLTACSMVASVGMTYSRYQSKTSEEILFQVKKPGNFTVTGLQTDDNGTKTETELRWQIQRDGTYRMPFRIRNDEAETATDYYRIRLMTTEGVTENSLPEEAGGITLYVVNGNGKEHGYAGTATAITEDSEAYRQIGAGYEYRFYNEDGTELVWELEDTDAFGEYILQTSHLDETSLMKLVIEEVSYHNEVTYESVCQKTVELPTSNCLVEGGQTVLLSDWEIDSGKTMVEVPITIQSAERDSIGYLSCTHPVGVIQAGLYTDAGVPIQSDELFTVESGTSKIVTLKMTMDSRKAAELSSDTTQNIQVVWNTGSEDQADHRMLSGAFRITLVKGTSPTDGGMTAAGADVSQQTQEAASATVAEMDYVKPECDNFTSMTPWVAKVQIPEDATAMDLRFGTDGDQGKRFPAYTRYSIDGGNTYTMLYNGGAIHLTPDGGRDVTLLIDFHKCEYNWVTASDYVVESTVTYVDQKVSQTDHLPMASENRERLQVSANAQLPFVTAETSLELQVDSDVGNVDYILEYLTKSGYVSVDTATNPIQISANLDQEQQHGSGTLTISSEGGTALPGTYRLSVRQKVGGVVVEKKEIVLFVHYREAQQQD